MEINFNSSTNKEGDSIYELSIPYNKKSEELLRELSNKSLGKYMDRNNSKIYFEVLEEDLVNVLNFIKNNAGFKVNEDLDKLSREIEENNGFLKNIIKSNLKIKFENWIKNNEFEKNIIKTQYKNDWFEFEKSLRELKRQPINNQKYYCFLSIILKNSANFSDPGAGKTQISLMKFNFLKRYFKDLNLFIVGPKSSLKTWEDEISKVLNISESKVTRFTSENKEKGRYTFNRPQIFITNPEYLKSIVEKNEEYFFKFDYMIVVDEVHRLKNFTSKRRNYINKLSIPAKFRDILTGTPISKEIFDIYSILKILWPNQSNELDIKKFREFSSLVGKDSWNYKENVFFIEAQKIVNRVSDIVNPLYFKMRKLDMGIENSKIIIWETEFDELQQQNSKEILKVIEKSEGRGILWGLLRLRQNSSNPKLLNIKILDIAKEAKEDNVDELNEYNLSFGKKITNEEISNLDNELSKLVNKKIPKNYVSPKLNKLLDLVDNIISKDNEKVVIWANFRKNIREIYDLLLNKYGDINLVKIIDGSVPLSEREYVIDLMNKHNTKTRILIANPMSTGESISLHETTWNSIFLERDYNASKFIQAKDRIHRLGLPLGKIVCHNLLTNNSLIDKHVEENLNRKEKLLFELIKSKSIVNTISDKKFIDIFDDENKLIVDSWNKNYK